MKRKFDWDPFGPVVTGLSLGITFGVIWFVIEVLKSFNWNWGL